MDGFLPSDPDYVDLVFPRRMGVYSTPPLVDLQWDDELWWFASITFDTSLSERAQRRSLNRLVHWLFRDGLVLEIGDSHVVHGHGFSRTRGRPHAHALLRCPAAVLREDLLAVCARFGLLWSPKAAHLALVPVPHLDDVADYILDHAGGRELSPWPAAG